MDRETFYCDDCNIVHPKCTHDLDKDGNSKCPDYGNCQCNSYEELNGPQELTREDKNYDLTEALNEGPQDG